MNASVSLQRQIKPDAWWCCRKEERAMAEYEPKPCPFCGGKAQVRYTGCGSGNHGYTSNILMRSKAGFVICLKCGCRTPIHNKVSRAINKWNRRADSGVTAQEWISVKDMLPKNDEIVIICTDKNFIYAGELIGDTWFLDNDSWTATVTHWMPLPQPPKGE